MAMLLGLLAPLGCASWQMDAPAATPVTVTNEAQPGNPAATELNPQQAALLALAAAEALEKKGYTAEAIQQYENARVHDPQLKTVARRLAVLYDKQGDAQRAEAEYQRALNEQPGDAELLNDLGYFHYCHDRAKNAEAWLRNAIAIDPNCRCAWINLGQTLAKQGRFDECFQAFAHVLRPAEAYSNLGVLLAKQGRTEEARTAFQQALTMDPSLQQPKAFLSALSRPPALLPPGITRTPPPTPPVVSSAPPSPRILPSVPPPTPVRTASTPLPVLTSRLSPIVPRAEPMSPSTCNLPAFSPSTPSPSPTNTKAPQQAFTPTLVSAVFQTPQAVVQAAPAVAAAPTPLPVITHVPLPPPAAAKTSAPALMPSPLPVVLNLSPTNPGKPLGSAVSSIPPSPKPVIRTPSLAGSLPADLHTPSPELAIPPCIHTATKPAPALAAKPTPAPQSDGPILQTSERPTVDPDTWGRSPIVILTDCERAKDASPH